MQVALYSPIAQQQWEKHYNNARLGVALAFLMESPAFQNHNAPPIKLNYRAKIWELMELAFGLLIRIHRILELVDFNYALMQLPILTITMDVPHL